MTRRKTQIEFINDVRKVHGDNVEVLGEYVNNVTPVLIRYKDCGHEEEKLPVKLINKKHGCIQCRYIRLSETKTKSTNRYIRDLKSKGIDYIDILGEYNGVKEKVLVKNRKCGHTYEVNAGNLLNQESGCPICHGIKNPESYEEIIESKYPGEYVILGEYKNGLTPILTRHVKCGYEWMCVPKGLLTDRKCPNCMKSKGEEFIRVYLEKQGIAFKREATFDGCRSESGTKLRFDFAVYIDGEIRIIEFDGTHHFRAGRTMYRSDSVFANDKIKNAFCKDNNIPMLRIPYWWAKNKNKMLDVLDEFCKKGSTTIETAGMTRNGVE